MIFARNPDLEAALLDRFVRYVQISTTSEDNVTAKPSTARQWDLLNLLAAELRALGLASVEVDRHGYVLATLPASAGQETTPGFALLAHVDTSHDAPGEHVKPLIHRDYDGGALRLPAGLVLDPAENPLMKDYVGGTLITSDGSTLLGADDKAGVAEIMTALAWLKAHPQHPHPALEVVFTSDEEVGRGTEDFPLERLKSRAAYTVDGGEEGLIETECYTAFQATVTFTGVSHHPGYARGKLVNAVSMAAAFVSLLPRNESPEATDGRFGCLWADDLKATIEKAVIQVNIRDFSRHEAERRVASVRTYAQAVLAAFPGGTVEVSSRAQYHNMKEELDKHPEVVHRLEEAVRRAGIEPFSRPIRGGTDGSRLTALGLPTPNIFTGGVNWHSRTEWAALPAMVRATQTLIELAAQWAR